MEATAFSLPQLPFVFFNVDAQMSRVAVGYTPWSHPSSFSHPFSASSSSMVSIKDMPFFLLLLTRAAQMGFRNVQHLKKRTSHSQKLLFGSPRRLHKYLKVILKAQQNAIFHISKATPQDGQPLGSDEINRDLHSHSASILKEFKWTHDQRGNLPWTVKT